MIPARVPGAATGSVRPRRNHASTHRISEKAYTSTNRYTARRGAMRNRIACSGSPPIRLANQFTPFEEESK